MSRKLAAAAAIIASLAAGGVYLYPEEMRLLQSDPASEERIPHLSSNEIELLFNKPVALDSSYVDVTAPGGAHVAVGKYLEDGILVVKLKAPTRSGYANGAYRVTYYVKAADGKRAKGAYTFHNDHDHGGHKH
jgi:methionine-rich copper-binding protein CopC